MKVEPLDDLAAFFFLFHLYISNIYMVVFRPHTNFSYILIVRFSELGVKVI